MLLDLYIYTQEELLNWITNFLNIRISYILIIHVARLVYTYIQLLICTIF